MQSLKRRTLLQYSLGGMALSALPGSLLGQQSSSVSELPGGGFLITTGGANQVALATGQGLILVDSGPAAATPMLQAALDGLDAGAVTTLFNTHWHGDQVGGNAVFGDQGAKIIAHQKTRQRLSTDYYIPHESRYQRALPRAAWPTEFFHDRGEMTSGNESIDYSWLVEPHTDGDIYVFFRQANILVVGDAVSPQRDPELDWYGGGWLGGRVNSQDMLLEISNADTLIVPAYGPVMTRAQLQAERDLTQEIYNRVLDLIREGCSAGCMLAEGALDGLGRRWTDPDKFLYDAYKGMWAHHYNLAPNIL